MGRNLKNDKKVRNIERVYFLHKYTKEKSPCGIHEIYLIYSKLKLSTLMWNLEEGVADV